MQIFILVKKVFYRYNSSPDSPPPSPPARNVLASPAPSKPALPTPPAPASVAPSAPASPAPPPAPSALPPAPRPPSGGVSWREVVDVLLRLHLLLHPMWTGTGPRLARALDPVLVAPPSQPFWTLSPSV